MYTFELKRIAPFAVAKSENLYDCGQDRMRTHGIDLYVNVG